jgi:hypothetical protein
VLIKLSERNHTHAVNYRQSPKGGKMTLSDKATAIALAIWREQLARGLGQPDEVVDESRLDEWLANRAYDESLLEEAADGDVYAIVRVRSDAGLPIFS